MAQSADLPPSNSIPGKLLHLAQSAVVRCDDTKAATLGRVLVALTNNFDTKQFNRLRAAIVRDYCNREGGDLPEVSAFSEDGRKDWQTLPSSQLVALVAVGLAAANCPGRFLSSTGRVPATAEQQRQLSEFLYWFDGYVTCDMDRVVGWHSARAITAAGFEEIQSRLQRHEASAAVHEVISQQDRDSLRRLLSLTEKITPRGIRAWLRRTGDLDLITVKLVEAIRARTTDDRPFAVLALALDGQFDVVPRRAKDRTVSEYRKAAASKRRPRGLGTEASRLGDGEASKFTLRSVTPGRIPPVPPSWSRNAKDRPEYRTLRAVFASPDTDPTARGGTKQLAHAAGVSTETVRKHLRALQKDKPLYDLLCSRRDHAITSAFTWRKPRVSPRPD